MVTIKLKASRLFCSFIVTLFFIFFFYVKIKMEKNFEALKASCCWGVILIMLVEVYLIHDGFVMGKPHIVE